MENVGFYTGILTSNNPNDPGLDDLNLPFTQDTPTPFTGNSVVSGELQDDVVQSQGTEGIGGGRRAKKGASHRQKKLTMRKIKSYALLGCKLAKISLTGPIKLVQLFGVEFVHSLMNTRIKRQPSVSEQRILLCIGGSLFRGK